VQQPFPATLQGTGEPGVYTVHQVGPQPEPDVRFVVHLDVPEQSNISPGTAPALEAEPARTGRGGPATADLWPWLAALALLAVGVEWVVFLHR
jgi:hypothetical protein